MMNNQKKKSHNNKTGPYYQFFSRFANSETFQENRKRFTSTLIPHEEIMAELLRSVNEEEDRLPEKDLETNLMRADKEQ